MPRLPQLEYFSQLIPSLRFFADRFAAGGARAIALLLLSGLFCVVPATDRQDASIKAALRTADGDSAMIALIATAQQNSNNEPASDALLRAAFVAYVGGDAGRAQDLFKKAEDAGVPEARLWRGLALLSDGRTDKAARCLRGLDSGVSRASKEAGALALAACTIIDGDLESCEAKCREIIAGDGSCAVAAELLLRISVPDAVDREEDDNLARLIARRDPLSYESVLARHLPVKVPAVSAVTEEEIFEVEKGETDSSEDGKIGKDEGGTPAVEPTGAESAGRPGEFCVQVGAFADVRNAEALIQDLQAKGYDAVRMESETRKGALFHCVRVGRFESRDAALTHARALERDENLGTRVVECKRQAPH